MQRKSPRRARRCKSSLLATSVEKTVICISCAASGKQRDCSECARIQPKSLHERAREARESYARYWIQKSDLAFSREVARMILENRHG